MQKWKNMAQIPNYFYALLQLLSLFVVVTNGGKSLFTPFQIFLFTLYKIFYHL